MRVPKPSRWLLAAGPLLAGVSAGMTSAKLTHMAFWPAVGICLAVAIPAGLLPSLIYYLWLKASKR